MGTIDGTLALAGAEPVRLTCRRRGGEVDAVRLCDFFDALGAESLRVPAKSLRCWRLGKLG